MQFPTTEAVHSTEPEQWLREVTARFDERDKQMVGRALAMAQSAYDHDTPPARFAHSRAVAGSLANLRLDAQSLAAALTAALPTVEPRWRERVERELGAEVAALIEGMARMGQFQSLRLQSDDRKNTAERAAQLEALRKMLLAMVQDMRVVLLKLADQTQTLRELAAHGADDARRAAARDTFEIFAPLANRLGIWQLKWELEDLAFRCEDPATYKRIARELDEKRGSRESFIADVMERLRAELKQANVAAEVTGRPKHIFSIYKKLARKDLALKDLFDVRGVPILVNDVKDCYAALGLVHNLWTPLPKEFDDYIAKPKPNNYRSLHTAVVGPDQKVLEVQIRTHEMHRHCEYGVAAHWRYKEGSGADASFDEKIAWLRQILDWKDGLADVSELADYFRTGLFDESVYVLTPQGRVVDLPKSSTPVDFAYHVHSELGHRCRGAKVDGEMVPLTHQLSNGQTVEIVAAKSGGPSRDWLNAELGYAQSSRARAKVRQWFNNQNLEAAMAQGREVVEKVLQREGRTALGLDVLAERLGHKKVDELLANVGRGELSVRQLENAARGAEPAKPAESTPPDTPPRESDALRKSGDVLVVGVDKLLTVLGKCCRPAPPDPIVGFVTRGRGVTVHRKSCPNVARLAAERMITAEWGRDAEQGRFPIDVEVDGNSDPELMRHLLDIFSREKVRVAAAKSSLRDFAARLSFTLEVNGLPQVRRLLSLLAEVPGVSQARRK